MLQIHFFINKNVFTTFFVKIIKKWCETFFIKLLNKNIFATFLLKQLKIFVKNVFLLNYMLKNVSQYFLTVLIKKCCKTFFLFINSVNQFGKSQN
jgi:hypothetical protein